MPKFRPRPKALFFVLTLPLCLGGAGCRSTALSSAAPRVEVASKDMEAADTLWEMGRFLEADALYRRLIVTHPQDVTAHYRLGWIQHHYLRQSGEAEVLYRKAIRLNPNFAAALAALGELTFEVKSDAAGAEALYRRAIACQNDGETHLQLARLLLQTGRTKDARAEGQIAWTMLRRPDPLFERLGIGPRSPAPRSPRPKPLYPPEIIT